MKHNSAMRVFCGLRRSFPTLLKNVLVGKPISITADPLYEVLNPVRGHTARNLAPNGAGTDQLECLDSSHRSLSLATICCMIQQLCVALDEAGKSRHCCLIIQPRTAMDAGQAFDKLVDRLGILRPTDPAIVI